MAQKMEIQIQYKIQHKKWKYKIHYKIQHKKWKYKIHYKIRHKKWKCKMEIQKNGVGHTQVQCHVAWLIK